MIFQPGTSSAVASGTVTTTSTATSTGATLNVTGRNVTENEYIRLGAFHTLDLEPNRDVKIIKDEWDSIALARVDEACEEGRGAEVGAIVCGEGKFNLGNHYNRNLNCYSWKVRRPSASSPNT